MTHKTPLKYLITELQSFLSAYQGGMYPNFVFKNKLNDVIPIFCYHRIQYQDICGHLDYLRTNNYNTLTGNELSEKLGARPTENGNDVVLTFDDGIDNLYTDVYPALQKFGFTAIAYIVPAWIGRTGFLSWTQVVEMHNSGLVDFQSHSMNHYSIFTSPRIIDFFNPNFFSYAVWDLPSVHEGSDGQTGTNPPFGTPVYTWNSRLSDERRYIPEERIHDLCTSYVNRNGGKSFFMKNSWRRNLRDLIRAQESSSACRSSYENEAEQRKAIEREIATAETTLESHLSGKNIQHFAFPWNKVGQKSCQILRERRYRTISQGMTENYQHQRSGDMSFELSRLSGDFIPTLPGTGRKSFWNIMLRKMLRRVQRGTTY